MKRTRSIALVGLMVSVVGCTTIQSQISGRNRPAREISVSLPAGAEIEMVWIEPGTFEIGSPVWDDLTQDGEKPEHRVTITKGFYLGKYELTQGQWESVMGTRPWAGKSQVLDNPSHPAVYISWDDVQAFIDSLNTAEGAGVYRLPAEAEWEYACRAGTITRWSFGDDDPRLTQFAWYRDSACGLGECYAHAVGTKSSNPWGLYDMHGNVWESVQDWYGSYTRDLQIDPVGPPSGSDRVFRGGSFNEGARFVRSAQRDRALPNDRRFNVGVRILRQEP